MTYGYCRVSTKSQNIDRQERNILALYPKAIILKEAYTGTSMSRPQWDKLYKKVQEGDTIVFDSVSRMSRTADEGMNVYEELYNRGVNLIFLNEPTCNTDVFREALNGDTVPMTGTDIDGVLRAINNYLIIVAKKQVKLSFEQAEKEVEDLHQRTIQGLETAKLNGRKGGRPTAENRKAHIEAEGKTSPVRPYESSKSVEAKKVIAKHSKDFNGTLEDADVIKLAGISRNSYYKYKRELREEA